MEVGNGSEADGERTEMAKIIVLGAGMVGRAIALDLAKRHEVTAADIDAIALRELRDAAEITALPLDVTEKNRLVSAIADSDLVVSAVPGFLGFETLRTVVDGGRNIVDISFCSENTLELDRLAKRRGVTALVDMGVAPGMDHVFLGHHDESMKIESFECLVGGLPKNRKWPFAYKAPFSPVDVIEEYTRPARYLENGHLVTKPALSDPELVEFERVGTLEAFNTDGLRTLLVTMTHIPNMKEKTLRYPGHLRLIQALKESGFFKREKIKVGDAEVSPMEFTSTVLIDEWTLAPGEEELTIMRVTIEGVEDGTTKAHVYHLYDEYDAESDVSSMARTTGYTCTAAAELILGGLFARKGVFPPELVGKQRRCFDHMLAYLTERGVMYGKDEQRTGAEPQ
jgi:saccharopine dehydrogenase-like NADP-dependent oxidoreductase